MFIVVYLFWLQICRGGATWWLAVAMTTPRHSLVAPHFGENFWYLWISCHFHIVSLSCTNLHTWKHRPTMVGVQLRDHKATVALKKKKKQACTLSTNLVNGWLLQWVILVNKVNIYLVRHSERIGVVLHVDVIDVTAMLVCWWLCPLSLHWYFFSDVSRGFSPKNSREYTDLRESHRQQKFSFFDEASMKLRWKKKKKRFHCCCRTKARHLILYINLTVLFCIHAGGKKD